MDDETIYSLSVKDLINILEKSHEFNDNPTLEVMTKVLKEAIDELVETRSADWYIEYAPTFLEKKLKSLEKSIELTDHQKRVRTSLRSIASTQEDVFKLIMLDVNLNKLRYQKKRKKT